MIISKKKYEKLNNDLVDAKAKVDDAKKELDDENKIMRATLLIKEQRDQLKAERDTLIDDLSWYKAKVSRFEQRHSKLADENTRLQNELYTMGLNQDEADDKIKELERENEEIKESHIKHITNMENYYKDRVQELKEKNGELQEVIEGKNSGLIFAEDENEQLKESRDWDYEYIVKVNEENKRLEDENEQLKKENEMIDEQFTDYIDETCGYLKLLSEISQHIGNKPSSSTYKYFRAKLDGIGIKEDE